MANTTLLKPTTVEAVVDEKNSRSSRSNRSNAATATRSETRFAASS